MTTPQTLSGAERALPDIVRQAWNEILPGPFDPASTWHEAGADSLATLHLLLALEKALGCKLSFDLIEPDMSVARLAAAVAAVCHPALAPPGEAPRSLPVVFLFPGAFGDEPMLADFRRTFRGRLGFEVMVYPDLDARRATQIEMAGIARLAVRSIQERHPQGPLRLAGYSFGGCVAFEAARQLQAQGRRIGTLVLFDSAPTPGRARMSLFCTLGDIDRLRPLLMAAVRRWRPDYARKGRRLLLTHWRHQAMQTWQPEPLRAEHALLAASAGCPAQTVESWQRLCPGLAIVRLPGNHVTLFQPPSMALLDPAFEHAVRGALQPA